MVFLATGSWARTLVQGKVNGVGYSEYSPDELGEYIRARSAR